MSRVGLASARAREEAPLAVASRRRPPGSPAGAHLLLAVLALGSCVETTGGNVVTFTLEGQGDPAVVSPGGGPLTFTTPAGYEVTLDRARLLVGAVYFSQQNPQNYTLEPSCIQPGVYSGEVRGGRVLDVLDATPQPFPVPGNGTDVPPTRGAELWLTSGEIDAEVDRAVVLDVAGTARRGAEAWPFEGQLTISTNRVQPPRNPALPGSNPLCRQRIVAPIIFDAELADGATVRLQVDPRAFFASVQFDQLAVDPLDPSRFRFIDSADSSRQPDQALYNGLRSASGPYRFEQVPR